MANEPDGAGAAATPSEADRETLLAAFVGRSWERHYRRSFAALGASRSPWRGHWNWAAASAPFWLAARRLLALQVAAGLVWIVLFAALTWLFGESTFLLPAALALLAVAAGEGYWGDRWLFARAQRVVRTARGRDPDPQRVLAEVGRRGGRSLVLAAPFAAVILYLVVEVPRQAGDSYEKIRMATMRNDLRNLVVAEARYFDEHGSYTATLGEAAPGVTDSSASQPLDVPVTTGVTLDVTLLSRTAYYATARYRGTEWVCRVWVGAAPPELRGTPEGQPTCR